MKFIRHAAILCIALNSGLASTVLYAQILPTQITSSIIGQWNFETATGTTRTGDKEIDLMGKGLIQIAYKGQVLIATIGWLDERGDVQSLRKMEGRISEGNAIFTHSGTRTHTSPRGKETSIEVNVIWKLQAKDNVLSGTRLIEYGDDAAKPVLGSRSTYPIKPLVITSTAPVERGPSTLEERTRVVKMAADSEKNPTQIQAANDEWLTNWVNDVPDLTLNRAATEDWLARAAKQEIREIVKFQFMASVMSFQIQNPTLANKQSANDLAGMEGVLRAYETLLIQNLHHRSAKMDAALAARDKGELPIFLKIVSGRD
ncbi:hypothetical protein [Undibacterium sp. RuTC16W]|uniref:hypothetical protein n=1 Tax=Undibacterium sp. RuTC16W TaxID=3413048 RepID=UPI003BF36417